MILDSVLHALEQPPAAIGAALAAVGDPHHGAELVATALAHDGSIGRDLLRVGAVARAGSPATPSQAAGLLGPGTVVGVGLARWLARMTPPHMWHFGELAATFWQHCVAAGAAAAAIASDAGLDVVVASAAGTLHDLGKLALAPELAQQRRRVARWLEEGVSMRQIEVRLCGADHAVVGAAVLDGWKASPSLVEAVHWHHVPERAPATLRPYADVVHVASALARAVGFGSDLHGLHRGGDPAATRRLGLSAATLERAAASTIDAIAAIEWMGPRPTRRSMRIHAVSAV
jgi:putative nucleotidyltransferase with HDIG domain